MHPPYSIVPPRAHPPCSPATDAPALLARTTATASAMLARAATVVPVLLAGATAAASALLAHAAAVAAPALLAHAGRARPGRPRRHSRACPACSCPRRHWPRARSYRRRESIPGRKMELERERGEKKATFITGRNHHCRGIVSMMTWLSLDFAHGVYQRDCPYPSSLSPLSPFSESYGGRKGRGGGTGSRPHGVQARACGCSGQDLRSCVLACAAAGQCCLRPARGGSLCVRQGPVAAEAGLKAPARSRSRGCSCPRRPTVPRPLARARPRLGAAAGQAGLGQAIRART